MYWSSLGILTPLLFVCYVLTNHSLATTIPVVNPPTKEQGHQEGHAKEPRLRNRDDFHIVNRDMHSHRQPQVSDLPRFHGINRLPVSHAQHSIDCAAFLQPIQEKRLNCLNNATANNNNHIVDICVYFASDYNYLIPFLAHHLALGAHRIFIYNNDEKVQWYHHPTITCLLEHRLIEIQPWFGENVLMKGLDHCYHERIPDSYQRDIQANDVQIKHNKKVDTRSSSNKLSIPPNLPSQPILWASNFDVDEMLVLHKHTCLNTFVSLYNAPSIALNWAFFTPEYPLTDYSRTGNIDYMPIEHRSMISHYPLVLPHEMLIRRMHENEHIKTINRLECADKFVNEHCPNYKPKCPYGLKPIDPQGHYITCGPWTPWVDNYYPIAQLNHYWTLSLSDFLRKIHRGKGGSYAKNTDQFRNTDEFFKHALPKTGFVNDTAMLQYYSPFFKQLKEVCPKCFDLSYYYMEN